MQYSNDLIRICLVISIAALAVMLALAIIMRGRPRPAIAAYEEPVHVVMDETGPHAEQATLE
jgi:hypothetical protein